MRALLSNPDKTKKAGAFLFFLVVIFGLYYIGISSAWLAKLIPDSTEWFVLNPEKGTFISSLMLAALLMMAAVAIFFAPDTNYRNMA